MTTDKIELAERIKGLNERALSVGRAFQSHQTGFIHYFHSMQVPVVHQAIPLYENYLFALALLRSRLVENVTEAKELLARLISFQCPETGAEVGNYPFYLHEYPVGQEAESSVRLLAPLYWIIKQFGHILGQELKKKAEKSLQCLMEYVSKAHSSKPFPYSCAVRLAAAKQACGELLGQAEWEEKGEEEWKNLAQPCDSWYSTVYLADIFIAFQMVEKQDPAWKDFWEFINCTWHRQVNCYIGPCIREWQSKEEPQPNLYDLFLGFFFGYFPPRLEAKGIYQLQAALIQPILPIFTSSPFLHSYEYSGLYKGQKWLLQASEENAYTILEKERVVSPLGEKTYTPFRFVIGERVHPHTLVCQGGKYSQASFKRNESDQSIELYFDLEAPFEAEERNICFFWDDHPDWKVLVDGEKAITFKLGQMISLQIKNKQQVRFLFELIEGEGQFLGHLTKGNRPGQIKLLEEEKHFQAYDRLLFIRSIRRKTPCRLKATVYFLSHPVE